MESIKYITGNLAKIKSAKQILEPLGIEVEHINNRNTKRYCRRNCNVFSKRSK